MAPVILGFIGGILTVMASLYVAVVNVRHSSNNTLFTVRANVKTTYRLKWLDEFRTSMSELLFLGREIYDPCGHPHGKSEDPNCDRRRLREVGAKLMVLLGRELKVGQASTRPQLASLIRDYVCLPSADREEAIETHMQLVFRERWDQIDMETGVPLVLQNRLSSATNFRLPWHPKP